MLVYENGTIHGSIGGGALEKEAIEKALEVIKKNRPETFSRNLVNDLAMCCGGTVEIFFEPIMNKKRLYIFGAGHVGKALASFAVPLNFNVSLIDDRYEMFEDSSIEFVNEIKENYKIAIPNLIFDENTMVVVATHDHAYDREILALVGNLPCLYIGMIGSERKVEIAKKNLLGHLLSQEVLNKIKMPIGLPINSNTPEEIAISILAELILVRNKNI